MNQLCTIHVACIVTQKVLNITLRFIEADIYVAFCVLRCVENGIFYYYFSINWNVATVRGSSGRGHITENIVARIATGNGENLGD